MRWARLALLALTVGCANASAGSFLQDGLNGAGGSSGGGSGSGIQWVQVSGATVATQADTAANVIRDSTLGTAADITSGTGDSIIWPHQNTTGGIRDGANDMQWVAVAKVTDILSEYTFDYVTSGGDTTCGTFYLRIDPVNVWTDNAIIGAAVYEWDGTTQGAQVWYGNGGRYFSSGTQGRANVPLGASDSDGGTVTFGTPANATFFSWGVAAEVPDGTSTIRRQTWAQAAERGGHVGNAGGSGNLATALGTDEHWLFVGAGDNENVNDGTPTNLEVKIYIGWVPASSSDLCV